MYMAKTSGACIDDAEVPHDIGENLALRIYDTMVKLQTMDVIFYEAQRQVILKAVVWKQLLVTLCGRDCHKYDRRALNCTMITDHGLDAGVGSSCWLVTEAVSGQVAACRWHGRSSQISRHTEP